MRPRSDEILRSVTATFEEYILPEVQEPFARSLALTLANLMRHVAIRIEREGPELDADNAQLRDVLAQVRDYCSEARDCTSDSGARRALEDIVTAVDALKTPATTPYRTVADLIDEATELRGVLQRAIRTLEDLRAELEGVDPEECTEFERVRRVIRAYLRSSLEREMTLIVPAFTGERR